MPLTPEQQIYNLVDKANNILIVFKKTPSVDAVASALGLGAILKKMEKQVDIISDGFRLPENLSFLPRIDTIYPELKASKKFVISLDTAKTKVKNLSYNVKNDNLKIFITPEKGSFSGENISFENSHYNFDLIFCLSTPEPESLGLVYENNTEFFYEVPIINIDYHPNNEYFGIINLVDLVAGSTSEIIHKLIKPFGENLIDEDITTYLLTGIISETKNFKSLKITPNTLVIASQLITLGARREEIVNNLYRTKSIADLKLWGRTLARLKKDSEESRIIWSALTLEDFEKTQTNQQNLVGIADELIATIPEAEIIILIYENTLNKIGVQIKSCNKNIDIFKLVSEFKPQGDSGEVQLLIENKGITEVEQEVVKRIKQELKKAS